MLLEASMIFLEKTVMHQIHSSGYITSVNGMVHPDRIMKEHDFLYILDGCWEVFENDTAYELHTDSLLILAAGRHHYGRQFCNPGNRHMYIHAVPTPTELSSTLSSSGTDILTDACFKLEDQENVLCLPTHIDCRNHARIRQFFHEIIALEWSEVPERNAQRSLLFSLLLCELSNLLQSQSTLLTDPIVDSVCQKIASTPHTFFSANEIAAEYAISGRTLNNRFQKLYGKTFYTWQMETHLEMVRQFLTAQPQAKLSETALNYGFYDEFHLSKTFRKYFGQSPSEYRKERGRTTPAKRK